MDRALRTDHPLFALISQYQIAKQDLLATHKSIDKIQRQCEQLSFQVQVFLIFNYYGYITKLDRKLLLNF